MEEYTLITILGKQSLTAALFHNENIIKYKHLVDTVQRHYTLILQNGIIYQPQTVATLLRNFVATTRPFVWSCILDDSMLKHTICSISKTTHDIATNQVILYRQLLTDNTQYMSICPAHYVIQLTNIAHFTAYQLISIMGTSATLLNSYSQYADHTINIDHLDNQANIASNEIFPLFQQNIKKSIAAYYNNQGNDKQIRSCLGDISIEQQHILFAGYYVSKQQQY